MHVAYHLGNDANHWSFGHFVRRRCCCRAVVVPNRREGRRWSHLQRPNGTQITAAASAAACGRPMAMHGTMRERIIQNESSGRETHGCNLVKLLRTNWVVLFSVRTWRQLNELPYDVRHCWGIANACSCVRARARSRAVSHREQKAAAATIDSTGPESEVTLPLRRRRGSPPLTQSMSSIAPNTSRAACAKTKLLLDKA